MCKETTFSFRISRGCMSILAKGRESTLAILLSVPVAVPTLTRLFFLPQNMAILFAPQSLRLIPCSSLLTLRYVKAIQLIREGTVGTRERALSPPSLARSTQLAKEKTRRTIPMTNTKGSDRTTMLAVMRTLFLWQPFASPYRCKTTA